MQVQVVKMTIANLYLASPGFLQDMSQIKEEIEDTIKKHKANCTRMVTFFELPDLSELPLRGTN